jgi:hypothetical protein
MHMHLFLISIGRRDTVRLEFAVFAIDGTTALRQHMCLAEPGDEFITVREVL